MLVLDLVLATPDRHHQERPTLPNQFTAIAILNFLSLQQDTTEPQPSHSLLRRQVVDQGQTPTDTIPFVCAVPRRRIPRPTHLLRAYLGSRLRLRLRLSSTRPDSNPLDSTSDFDFACALSIVVVSLQA